MELMFLLILVLGLMLMKRHSPFSYRNTGVKAFAMDIQRFAITLPVNPAADSGTVGKDYLLYVWCDPAGGTSYAWTVVGAQRGLSLNETAEELDMTNKSSGGHKVVKITTDSWSLDVDGLVPLSDTGIKAIAKAKKEKKDIKIKLEYPDKTYQSGWAAVTEWSKEFPYDGEATYKGTLVGNGALEDIVPDISPLTATLSKADPSDKVFAILPTTTTISGVTDDGAAVTVTSEYTYSSGTFTLKSAYLAALAVGVHTYVITTGGGETLTVRIAITA